MDYSRTWPWLLMLAGLLLALLLGISTGRVAIEWSFFWRWLTTDGMFAPESADATAKAVNLLFWNGQTFDEPALKPVGKYRAAQATFRDATEIDPEVIRGWMKKAKSDVFDSKAFFKKLREGK